MKNKFLKKYHFLSDLKIPENIPQYLKKAITVFNELMTDLRSISIQYENKINGLYALFVALERVNMRYIEKMKSRNNNPQTAKQQLKARLQICKNMKQVLKNTKRYEDVLTDKQKNLLPNSCNIDPLKPHSESLTELTNPYFKKPPTKQAKIPDLLTKEKSTLKFEKDKLSKMSPSPDSTASREVLLSQIQDTVQGLNKCSSTTISTKSETLHPWCKFTRTREEFKDKSTEKASQAKEQNRIDSKLLQVLPDSARIQDSEENKEDLIDLSILENNIEVGTTRKSKNEMVTKQNEKKEMRENESFLSSLHRTVPQQKVNIKHTKREIHTPPPQKKKVLSIQQHEEAYPWEKDAAKNRENETPFSNEIRKITEGVNKLLPQIMKSRLFQIIEYPDSVNMKIDNKIQKKDQKYVCVNCASNPSFSSNRKNTLQRHVKVELGYYIFRCSFCDEKSNDPRTLINHYASTHGIPTKWLSN